MGFTDWQQVGSIGAHSLPPFWGDSERLKSWVETIPFGQMPRVYMDIGKLDQFYKPASEFETLLAKNRVPFTWVVNDGKHEEAYWQAHVEEYLKAVDAAFAFVAGAVASGKPEKYLKGPVCHAGFKRLN